MGHIGNDKSFQDLPLTPPDYDFELKIAFCCLCFSKTVYEYKAKNQMATPDVEAQGPQSTVLPEQNQMATPDFTPHRLYTAPPTVLPEQLETTSALPLGWEERMDPGWGKSYYVDHNTQ